MGQAVIRARRGRLGRPALPVIGLIALLQMHDLFIEITLMLHRRDERVGDDVVDEVSAHRAGIAEIVHLDRRRAMRHDRGGCVSRIAFQVDQNVDAVRRNTPRALSIGQPRHDVEAVEGAHEPPPHQTAIVGAEAIGEGLETGAVMALDQLRDQARRGVLEEVRGQIADTDTLAPAPDGRAHRPHQRTEFTRFSFCINFTKLRLIPRSGSMHQSLLRFDWIGGGRQLFVVSHFRDTNRAQPQFRENMFRWERLPLPALAPRLDGKPFRPVARQSKMILRRTGHRQRREGLHALAAFECRRDGPALGLLQPVPVANMAAQIAIIILRGRRRLGQGEQSAIDIHRLVHLPLILEHAAQAHKREIGAGREAHRLPQGRERLVGPAGAMQQRPHIDQRLDQTRLQRQRPRIGRERLVLAADQLQRQPEIAMRLRAVGVDFDGAPVGRKRLAEAPLRLKHAAEPRMHQRQRWVAPQRLLISRHGFGKRVPAMQDQPLDAIGVRERRREANRVLAGGFGLLQPAERDQGVGAVRVGGGETGQQLDSPRIGRLGGGGIALALHKVAEIAMGGRNAAVEGDRLAASRDRLLIAPRPHEHHRQIGLRLRIARPGGKAPSHEPQGVLTAPKLVLDDGQMMQRDDMARLGGQQLEIGSAGLVQPPGLQMTEGCDKLRLPARRRRLRLVDLPLHRHAGSPLLTPAFTDAPHRQGSALDRDHIHDAVTALARHIGGRLEAVLLQQLIQPVAREIVIVLDIPPGGIVAADIAQAPDHGGHVRGGDEQHAARFQQPVSRIEHRPRIGCAFEAAGHGQDAEAERKIQLFKRGAIGFEAKILQRFRVDQAFVQPHRLIAPFLCGEQQRGIAEAGIEPVAGRLVARDMGDDLRGRETARFRLMPDRLIRCGSGQHRHIRFGREIALREDMPAGPAAAPDQRRRKRRIIIGVAGAIGFLVLQNVGAVAKRAGFISDPRDAPGRQCRFRRGDADRRRRNVLRLLIRIVGFRYRESPRRMTGGADVRHVLIGRLQARV